MSLSPQLFFAVFLRFFALVRTEQAEPAEEECQDECQVLLLQTNAGLQRQNVVQPSAEDPQAAQAARIDAALPLVWLHVPKTGSSFMNALLRVPGACDNMSEELGDDSFHLGADESIVTMDTMTDLCDGLAQPPLASGTHVYVGDESMFNEHYDGHGVTMLRQPEQRLISGMRHTADALNVAVESMQFSEGCAARMLSGDDPDWMGSDARAACVGIHQDEPEFPPPVLAADVTTAVARLRRFAFVGIQEEWHLSVCLLHALFGGECQAVEFENIRLGTPSDRNGSRLQSSGVPEFAAPEPYDTSILGGWVDTADRAVYDVGLEMFHAMCEEHGVTPESCRPCFQSAGLL